jgi:RNA polymerase sigma factor (sigma-70 family)
MGSSSTSERSADDVLVLFARARTGDNAAWAELFQTCYPKVVRVVRRKLNRPMRSLYDSTDFASDVMKSLAAKADRLDFDSPDSLYAFLVRLAEEKVIDEYRRVHTQKRDIQRQQQLGSGGGVGDSVTGPAIADGGPTPSQVALADEVHERLLSGQSEPERAVIEMKQQGYSVAEIAEETGWHKRKVQRFFSKLWDSFHRSDGQAI